MPATGEASDKAIVAISRRFNVSKQNTGRVVMTESTYFSSAVQKISLTSRVSKNIALSTRLIQRPWHMRGYGWQGVQNEHLSPRLGRNALDFLKSIAPYYKNYLTTICI